jgi:hypothetical protein
MELGEEPPAVVDLLTNDWRVTADAIPATLLDLRPATTWTGSSTARPHGVPGPPDLRRGAGPTGMARPTRRPGGSARHRPCWPWPPCWSPGGACGPCSGSCSTSCPDGRSRARSCAGGPTAGERQARPLHGRRLRALGQDQGLAGPGGRVSPLPGGRGGQGDHRAAAGPRLPGRARQRESRRCGARGAGARRAGGWAGRGRGGAGWDQVATDRDGVPARGAWVAGVAGVLADPGADPARLVAEEDAALALGEAVEAARPLVEQPLPVGRMRGAGTGRRRAVDRCPCSRRPGTWSGCWSA